MKFEIAIHSFIHSFIVFFNKVPLPARADDASGQHFELYIIKYNNACAVLL